MEKFPGTIITGILNVLISLVTNALIIGPGFFAFSSVFAAKTKTLIFCSYSINFFNSDITSPSLVCKIGIIPVEFLTLVAAL